MRKGQRKRDDLRPVKIELNYLNLIPASTLIKQGGTMVVINATVINSVPNFLQGSGQGWLTAEYAMLPRCTPSRINRERKFVSGRTYEIQRFIGRSLRQAFDLTKIGEKTILVDCDVIQAYGGTRTASITGSFVSVYELLRQMYLMNEIEKIPLKNWLAALSVGIINGEIYLDLDYEEDSSADVDVNLVMDENGKIVEIQGTGERALFSLDELHEMINLTAGGIKELINVQKSVLNIG
ncbi:ribonuclease PH [candidate division WOR-3 bacterium]|nr:ribonuclease PH [candidate division WOR-3 bacterium]MCK4526555.1 ribonuclease PH [candidate division WOR-3 bacterium]